MSLEEEEEEKFCTLALGGGRNLYVDLYRWPNFPLPFCPRVAEISTKSN